MKKQSDIEKRLKLLRQQVYGKDKKLEVRGSPRFAGEAGGEVESHFAPQFPTSHIPSPTSHIPLPTSKSDVAYLNQDLLKIGLFATVAIGVQFILYILMQFKIINFKF